MAELAIKIDPGQAAQGARTIRKEIDGIQTSAEKMEKAVDKAAASAGKLGTGPAVSGARVIKRSVDDIAKAADNAGRSVSGFTGAANDNFARLNTQVASVTSTFRGLMAVMGPLAALFSVRQLQLYADTWSDIRSRVGIAVKDMSQADAVLDRIAQTARMTYSNLNLTAEGFVRNAMVLNELGKSTKQQLDYQEALNNALVVSGAKGQAAAFVQESLNRSMALGAMRGVELNNVLNYGGRIAELLAKHFNTTTGGLMKLAQQGKITGEVIYNVLVGSMVELREEAESMPATLADAFQIISNALLQTVGVFDQANKISKGFAENLIAVGDNIDVAFKALGVGALLLAARLAGPLVSAFAVSTLSGTRGIAMLGIYDVATKKLNVSLTAASVSARAFGAALSFVGGPVGLAVIAIGGAMYIAARNAQEASARSELYAEAIKKAGENSDGASGGIREAARALQELKTGATEAEAAVTRAMTQTNISVSDMTMAATIQKLGAAMGWASVEMQGDLQKLRREFFDGQISAEKFINKVDELSKLNPDASPVIAEIQRIAREAAAALGVMDALNKSIGNTSTPKGDRLVPPLSDGDFNKRFGGPYAKTWKELFPSLYKDIDKADDAYGKLISSAERHVFMLGQELAAVGKSKAQWDGYRFATDLFYRASEAAAKNNETLTDDQIKKIKALGVEYIKLAQAVEEARMKSDLTFEGQQIGRSDTEQRVAEAMRDLYGDEYQSHMNSAIAGQIRLNEAMQDAQDQIDDINDGVKDTFTGLIDLLYESGDAMEKLIGAFAQLGKMFAQKGAEKLFDFATGESSSLFGDMPTVGGGGVSVVNARASGTAMGQVIAPPIVSSLNTGLETYAAAIRKIESGSYAGNYSAVGEVVKKGMYTGDRAYGAYQVMGNNVASWTKAATGVALTQQQFLNDRAAQDKVFYTRATQAFDRFGNWIDTGSVWFTGQPVANTKPGQNDGRTTVPTYLSKLQSNMDKYDPNSLKRGVSAGVQDGIVKTAQKGIQQDQFDTTGPGSVAGMTRMQGMLGVGGAAIGAFAGGYQSGSPLMGGISGAMSGLGAAGALGAAFPALGAAAGPIGLIGGAIIGILGGIFGKAKQKREELKKAQQELENQIGAITNLMRTATGNYLGAMEKQFGDTVDEFQKAIALAEKAKNTKLATQLKDSMNEFFTKLVKDWNAGFEGTLASLNAGLGMDGEFLKGMDAVDKMRESLIGFVNDAKFFAEANGDLSKMLDARKKELGIGQKGKEIFKPKDDFTIYESGRQNPGTEISNDFVEGYKDLGLQLIEKGFQAFTEQGAQLYTSLTDLTGAAIKAGFAIDEQGKVTRVVNEAAADTVARAMEAARKTALASLSGGKTFSEIEQAIQRLEGAAASLPDLLEDLGMSAEEAADAIEHHLNYALDNLRKNYIDGLNASINDLSDFGFLNEIIAAQDKYRDRLIDTAALGLDGSLALKEFNLSLAKTIKGADLTQDQIDMLAAAFPAIAGIIDMLAGDDVIQQVEDAKSALQAAYDTEKAAIEQTISRLESFTKAIKTFRDEMRLSSSSPIGQKDQVDEAAKQFRDIAQKAMGGDEDAMDKLTGVSQSYLDEAREYYASSEDYFKIWNEVDKTLSNVEDKAGLQLTQAQKQLAALDKQVAGLININDSVLTVAQAIANLSAALGARDTALQDQIKAAQNAGQTADPFVTSLYKSVLNRAPDAEGAAYYTAFLKAGMSQSDLRDKFIANAQPEIDRGYPKFASGGDHMGGLRIVGERGPELEATGAARIFNARDTERMLRQSFAPQSYAPSNDNSGAELVKEVRALREQVARLESGQRQNTAAVGASGAAITGAVERGNEINRDTGSALKRAGARV